GGGIYNSGIQGGGLLQLYNCTLSRNSAAADGGALYNAGEPVQIYNSTISSNSSSAQGGAFYNFANNAFALFTIVNCTLSGNSSGSGSGIYNLALPGGGTASLQIGSTILNATTFSNDSFGTILSLGYNLSSDNGRGFLTNSG